MAGSVNKVILIGNLGGDPDVKTMQSGDKVVNLSVATSESWKDKTSGERQERTQWHRVVIWAQGIADVAEKYLRKGAKVYIEGQLETRKWTDKDGVERYSTEVVIRPYRGEMTMLGSKRDSAGSSGDDGYYNQDPGPAGGGASTPPGDFGTIDYDDEIPF